MQDMARFLEDARCDRRPATLDVLHAGGVDFVVVEGVALVLRGSPV
jgi:hypothetical protein